MCYNKVAINSRGETMNLLHFKYAVEVEKTKSITKAAENLFMGQPNLSRAIRDLEENLGIRIFKRTSQGVIPTEKGTEFLSYAKNILSQIEQMENLYSQEKQDIQTFSIGVPRAAYIADALVALVPKLDDKKAVEFKYNETNNLSAIDNVLNDGYNMAIIRCQAQQEKYFVNMLKEKNLSSRPIWEFEYLLLMSRLNPLCRLDEVSYEDLSQYIELAYDDYYVPSLSPAEIKEQELPDLIDKRVFVYERASMLELLSKIATSYTFASPVSDSLLDRYRLVQVPFSGNRRTYKDILIYRSNYDLSELDKAFLKELSLSIRAVEVAL